MRSRTVSAPVLTITTPLPSSNKKYVAVELLTKETLYFVVEAKSRSKELYSQTCAHLSNQGMVDCELFGLTIVTDGEYLFVDPENKLSKYGPKNWKSSSCYGLDSALKPTLVLHFRVQFYVDSPLLLRDEVTRHHYYLQLRHNVLCRGLLHACATEELLYVLAGCALQADLGDHQQDTHVGTYFQPADYFPAQMLCGEEPVLLAAAAALHRENHGMDKGQAELQYIREASSAEVSPLSHNSHLYRLKHKKQEVGQGSVWLSICAKGIEIYEENSAKTLTATFLWNDIGKLCFDRKKFEIRANNSPTGEKFTYFTNNDEKSKHLLFLCRVTHQFSMAIQPRMCEVRRKEEEERKRYRDCYMYSRSLGGEFSSLAGKVYKGHPSEQRISVISNTSSNTTSGIVSDRVQSLDESEDDLEDVEIMINSPPAPSVESLALAHLRDTVPSPTLAPDADVVDGCTPPLITCTQKTSPSSSAATPATTDGSQCSSSCSTVVVAGTGLNVAKVPVCESQEISRRQASTSSSLELGYSHTAQNSAISETTSTSCAELDYSVQSAQTSSGIYTLRSSCDTTAGTNACSSETSGVYVADNSRQGSYSVVTTSVSSDCNVAMRERSNSCAESTISASGSFRGDGSDPSDAGHRNLLTAEELSDLIVGRASDSAHASGVYPSHATISTNLDSDSDYVTLPPPPMPPPRTDKDLNYAVLDSSLIHPIMQVSPKHCSGDVGMERFTNLPNFSTRASSQQNLSSQQLHSFTVESSPRKLSRDTMSRSQKVALSPQDNLFSQSVNLSRAALSSPLINVSSPVEEANARFITTKPHINILTAHTSLIASTASPSFAAPTLAYQPPAVGTSQLSRTLHQPRTCVHGDVRTQNSCLYTKSISIGQPGSCMGYPMVHDSGAKMKPQTVKPQTVVPIIGKNNYLDVHASRSTANSGFLRSTIVLSQPQSGSPSYPGQQFHSRHFSPPPPPPVLHPRQPPPPPPTNQPALATVYTSQVTRSQIEQFQQQMYSDVDYVIYPMKDPAISKQEYIDAKQGSLIAHAAVQYPHQQYPPPPYPSYHSTSAKSHLMYRSTPNVAALGGYHHRPVSFSNAATLSPVKYASNQNLSSDYVGLSSPYHSPSHYSSTSAMYSAGASYSSSSSRSLRYDQLPFSMQLLPCARTRSDDNILNSYERPVVERTKYHRLPPPPPPPPYDQPVVSRKPSNFEVAVSLEHTKKPASTEAGNGLLDIRKLQEKSKNLDLPLISALCNDRSLLKQTNAFVMPKHPQGKQSTAGGNRGDRLTQWQAETEVKTGSAAEGKRVISTTKPDCVATAEASGNGTQKTGTLTSLLSGNKRSTYLSGGGNSKVKYPVSGLSTTQISKPQRKVSSSTHVHPHHDFGRVSKSGHGGVKTKDGAVQ